MTSANAYENAAEQYLKWLSSEIETYPLDDGYYVSLPFSRPDGEGIGLEVNSLPGGDIRITDMGDTLGYLFVNGLDLDDKMMDRAKFISKCYGVSLEDGPLAIEADPESIGEAFHCILQATIAVTDLIQMRRSTRPRIAPFDYMVESLIKHSAAAYDTAYQVSGKRETHTFGFYVNSGRNLLIQPITAPNAGDAHALAERWAYRFHDVIQANAGWQPLAVLDNRAEYVSERVIWTPRAIAPISEYAITWAERDKLAALLEGNAP